MCLRREASHKVRRSLDQNGVVLVAALFAAGVTPAAYGCGERFGFPVTAVVNKGLGMGSSAVSEMVEGVPRRRSGRSSGRSTQLSHRWPSSTTPFRPESQVAWLIEEGVALDHDDEAIARYARLKAEKGSYECVDDDEPVDES